MRPQTLPSPTAPHSLAAPAKAELLTAQAGFRVLICASRAVPRALSG
jgi:hypothetical protein